MSRITQLRIVHQERQLSVEEAWQRFVVAMERSKDTLELEDGLRAAKAYADFMQLFVRKAS